MQSFLKLFFNISKFIHLYLKKKLSLSRKFLKLKYLNQLYLAIYILKFLLKKKHLFVILFFYLFN